MAHARKQIRDQLATMLAGLATTGANVFTSRVYALAANQLPALRIYTLNESVEEEGTIGGSRQRLRELEVAIEAIVKAASNPDDTVDQIALEVEKALAADKSLSGLAKDSYISSTEIELDGEQEQKLVIATMTWTVQYLVADTAPDTPL